MTSSTPALVAADPIAAACGACGAEAGEPCRTLCVGAAAAADLAADEVHALDAAKHRPTSVCGVVDVPTTPELGAVTCEACRTELWTW